ncbi:MAG: acyl-CoA thioesterase, partial [Candidatus Omnitrophica bacterium]|nr:acyl-CoA thioesterase [Candidatus Omnitrophota bacterium]
MKIKIYYHHTDCGGVVYYGKYLEFLEEARTEYFEEKGFSLKELFKEGITFVVRAQQIEYLKPVLYGDILTIKTRIIEHSSVKLVFDYDIRNQNNEITTRARTVLVCVDRNFKLKEMPQQILRALCS